LSLIADDPLRAREELEGAAARWSHQGYQLQHYFHFVGDAEISLYAGAAADAWEGLQRRWKALERSLLLRSVQVWRIEARHLRARCALAAAGVTEAATDGREKLLQFALRDARRIAHEKTDWSAPLADLIRAGVASIREAKEEAARELTSAESGFERVEMALYRSAVQRARGLLLGGEEGRELVASAEEWMTRQKIQNPGCMTSLLAPGQWEVQAAGSASRPEPLRVTSAPAGAAKADSDPRRSVHR
jgi:hypothetical protein